MRAGHLLVRVGSTTLIGAQTMEVWPKGPVGVEDSVSLFVNTKSFQATPRGGGVMWLISKDQTLLYLQWIILTFTEQKIDNRNNRKYNNQNYTFEKAIKETKHSLFFINKNSYKQTNENEWEKYISENKWNQKENFIL
jgi:hypothetical protein